MVVAAIDGRPPTENLQTYFPEGPAFGEFSPAPSHTKIVTQH